MLRLPLPPRLARPSLMSCAHRSSPVPASRPPRPSPVQAAAALSAGPRDSFYHNIQFLGRCSGSGSIVYMEFNRIVGKNLKQEFYESIDRHSLRFIEIFQSQRGHNGQQLPQLSQQTRDSDDSVRLLEIGILLVPHEGAVLSSLHLNPASLKIIIDGEVMTDNIQDLPKAMCIFLGGLHTLCISAIPSL
ncbi:hypothetical protein AOLI_G00065600 [Acnodon oligacanthus]